MEEKNNTLKSKIVSSDLPGFPLKNSCEAACKLHFGQLVVDEWIKEEIRYRIDCFDWDMQSIQSPTTFQLFLQSLRPSAYLAGSFVQRGAIKDYELALAFVNSWNHYAFNEDAPPQSAYVWDQHTAALRGEYLLYILLIGREKSLLDPVTEDVLFALVMKHGKFLSDANNYLPRQNHGLFQDKALLIIGAALGKIDWYALAKSRIEEQWNYLFVDGACCVENSFAYQRINVNLFLDIAKFLNTCKDPDGAVLFEKQKACQDFMGHALVPNGFSPPYGDSEKDDYRDCNYISPDGVLRYASRQGREGIPPKKRLVLFKQGGYFFGREFWKSENDSNANMSFSDSVWSMFRSGYRSITHRQADDNSFLLYGRGEDIFADSGVYNYMFRDPLRQYVRSANAHNTVVVDGQSTAFLREDLMGFSGIVQGLLDAEQKYAYIAAYNALYYGVLHLRHYVFLGNKIVLYDELFSKQEHMYSQLFHCGKNIHIAKLMSGEAILDIADTGFHAVLRQYNKEGSLLASSIYGGPPDKPYGKISEYFNEIIPIHTLKFDKKGKNIAYLTTINVSDIKGAIEPDQITADIKNGMIVIQHRNDITIELPLCKEEQIMELPRFRYPMDNFALSLDDGYLQATNEEEYDMPMKYAWTITTWTARSRKTVWSSEPLYTADRNLYLDLREPPLKQGEVYALWAFILNPQTKAKQAQSIAFINFSDGRWQIERNYEIDAGWKMWEHI